MKLSPQKRESLRMMFGGHCAYCGVELTGKWHADHVEAVVRIPGSIQKGCEALGITDVVTKPYMLYPQHDHAENFFPACVRCNILKAASNVEGFRSMLAYFAHSIPRISGYSHVHHLMRFGKLSIDTEPVVFWFEAYTAQQKSAPIADALSVGKQG